MRKVPFSRESRCLTDQREWINALEKQLLKPFSGSHQTERQRVQAKLMEIAAYLDLSLPPTASQLREQPRLFLESWSARPCVTEWRYPHDLHRTLMLPPGHLLLIQADNRFQAELSTPTTTLAFERAFALDTGGFAALILAPPAGQTHQEYHIKIALYTAEGVTHHQAPILGLMQATSTYIQTRHKSHSQDDPRRHVICTNQRGTLSHMRAHWAEIQSKYDGILQANLHPSVPVDRHTMLTHPRLDHTQGFSRLNKETQTHFVHHPEGVVQWHFTVPLSDQQRVNLVLSIRLHPHENAAEITFHRLASAADDLYPSKEPIGLIIRPDIEDRTNHAITRAAEGLETHFPASVEATSNGFLFAPDPDRKLYLSLPNGRFHTAPEWHYQVAHPVDRDRATDGAGDLFSPGYFEIELKGDQSASLSAAINTEPTFDPLPALDVQPIELSALLKQAMRAFIVQRDELQTVIAGYPRFLDWGRDTLI